MEQYGVEWCLAHLLISGEDHTDNPEENDVISGDKHIIRVKIIQFFGLIRPAECRERPECGRKPGIQRIRVLCQMLTSALRANFRSGATYNDFTTVITVLSRDAVAPPELS